MLSNSETQIATTFKNSNCDKRAVDLKFLLSKWDYWKKPLISFSPGFCTSCLKWENPGGVREKCGGFFINVSSGFSSSWNSFHRYHPASWTFVIIHVEKTFRTMTADTCGKHFKKKTKIRKHFWKQHEHFLIPSKRYKFFWYLSQKHKVYLICNFPKCPTYSVKNLRSTALKN